MLFGPVTACTFPTLNMEGSQWQSRSQRDRKQNQSSSWARATLGERKEQGINKNKINIWRLGQSAGSAWVERDLRGGDCIMEAVAWSGIGGRASCPMRWTVLM